MKKSQITIIYNPFLNLKKITDQINLLKKSCLQLKIKTDFIRSDKVLSNIDLKNNNRFAKKILFLDKNIALAQMLELWGYQIYNNSHSINLCDNKAYTHVALLRQKIKQPKTFIGPITFGLTQIQVNDPFIKNVKQHLKYPFILKEVYGSFGGQVYLIKDNQELETKLKTTNGKQIIIQEFLKKYSGRSIRVIFINKKIVGAIYQHNQNDFRSNLTLGSDSKINKINQTIKTIIQKIIQGLDLFYGGIDLLIDDNKKLVFCEANSNVQLVNASRVLNINLAKILLEEIIKS